MKLFPQNLFWFTCTLFLLQAIKFNWQIIIPARPQKTGPPRIFLFLQNHDFRKVIGSETDLGRIVHQLPFPLNSKHRFSDSFVISLVVTSLNERKGWFVTKLSDDTAVLDFCNEFVSGKIDGKPTLAENRAGTFFYRK